MLPPIKIKICDRNKDMLASFGDKSARVETQSGQIVIKKEKDILKTDRVISFIPNDFISPIKIKISDLDIVYAFLESELARLAFFAQINLRAHKLLEFCKFQNKFGFRDILNLSVAKTFAKFHEKNTLRGIVQYPLSVFKDIVLPSSFRFEQNIKGIDTINEKLLPAQSVRINIPNISETIIYGLYYKTIGDITQGTLEDQFLGDKTIYNLFVEKRGK